MTQYDKAWPWLRYVLAPEKIAHILAQVFAEPKSQKSPLRRNREVRACDVLFQRRHRKTLRGRGTHPRAFTESAHIRSETGNERRRHH